MIQNEDELNKVKQFEFACDDMINGKLILSGVKIAKILKAIADSKELYAYFAECLLNFDFNKEFGKARVVTYASNYFKMPEEDYKKVALVFCFLIEVDNKNIDIFDFIKTFYGENDSEESYEKFTTDMILPFKNEVLKHFGLLEIEEVEEEEAQEVEQVPTKEKSIKEELIVLIQSMLNVVEISPNIKDAKKQELQLVLNGFIEAVELKNKKILFALEIALNTAVKKVKPIQSMYEEMLNKLIDFYKN